jgi:DNA-damage-inducible protein J
MPKAMKSAAKAPRLGRSALKDTITKRVHRVMGDVVRARIDRKTKREAEVVLAAIGLDSSSAFRLMMTRIAAEKALPFEPLVPNSATLDAMRETRAGKGKKFKTVDALMADLNADD